ncbi:trigger factor [Mycoplasma zalophi]|uniref:Trigger factor n=1 Tax=Mycoplasma zalophi TaxID=191287 RepID=A0ABS6DQU7_9MOLU|nr:trigger factor [Mycoplasma zalophi]MBU4692141.1 trigger factor [Mycoplasma zalophi]
MIDRKINKDTSELVITVEVDSKIWKEQQEKSLNKLRKEVQVKGYRKGKVPAEVADKHISSEQVKGAALKGTLDEAIKLAAEKVTDDDFVLDSAEYHIKEISDDNITIEFIYPLLPEIKLNDYKNLNVKLDSIEVSEEDVKNQLKALQTKNAVLYEVEEEKIEDGDRVNFDFKGFIDGEAFDGGEAEGFQLEIGSKSFIAGFEDALKQFKKGDEGSFEVTFPENYHMEHLRNKVATFKVKINKIERAQLSEVNEDFIKEINIENVTTLEELNDYLKDLTKREKIEKAKEKFTTEIFNKIVEESEYPLPSAIIRKEMQAYYKRFEDSLKQQGVNVEQYLEVTKSTKEKLSLEINAEVVRNLKVSFTYTQLAKDENIKLNDEDYALEYKKLSDLYKMPVEEIEKYITKEQIQIPLINQKIVATLAKYNDPENYKTYFGDVLETKAE